MVKNRCSGSGEVQFYPRNNVSWNLHDVQGRTEEAPVTKWDFSYIGPHLNSFIETENSGNSQTWRVSANYLGNTGNHHDET